MIEAEFHFDFGSPNCYLAHRVIPGIVQRTGVPFRYVPVLLGGVFKATNNRSPVEAFAEVKNKRDFMALETQRFIRRHAITGFHHNPFFPVNTLNLMRGAVAAQRTGCFDPYVDVVFRHMWSTPQKLDDPALFRALLDENQLDGAGLLALTQDPAVKQELMHNTQESVARGAFGSPTFFVGSEMFFGKDQLRDVEELILATHPMSPRHADPPVA